MVRRGLDCTSIQSSSEGALSIVDILNVPENLIQELEGVTGGQGHESDSGDAELGQQYKSNNGDVELGKCM